MIEQIERIPEAGETFTLQGLEIRILSMKEHVIQKACIRRLPEAEEKEEKEE